MIDASIPLQLRLPNYLEDEARRQQIAASRQRQQLEREDFEQQKIEKQTLGDAYAKILSGGRPDNEALGNLARVNPEAAFKVQQHFQSLDEQSRKREEGKWKAAAPLLVRAKQMPYEQRRQFIMSAAPALMANGWSPEELNSFDPTDQNVEALSSAAMTVDQVINGMEMKWHPVGENGSFATDQLGNPVGQGNPFAPQGQQQKPAGTLNDVFNSLIQQESGGRPGVIGQKTAYGIPLGKTQMLPATAREMANKLGLPWRQDLLTGASPEASAYQEKLGRAYFDEGLEKHGGNVEKALMYYHGGPDQKLWGPKTRTYAKAIMARAGGVPGGARKVSSREEYSALPSGTQYIAPDGSLRTKS